MTVILPLCMLVAMMVVIWGFVALVIIIQIRRSLRGLKAYDSRRRADAMQTLVTMGRYAIKPLIRALSDQHPDVRSGAAEVLGLLSDYRALSPLLRSLNDSEERVRWEAITALGRMKAEPAIEPLINILSYRETESRRRSVEALSNMGRHPMIEDSLIQALEDRDVIVRQNAIRALGERRRVESIVRMLEDEHAEVRLLAAETLDTIHWWNPGTKRESIAYHIAKRNWDEPVLSNPAAMEPLLRRLKDERAEKMNDRVNAAMILGKIGDRRAIDPLNKLLGHEHANIREVAIMALGEIGDSRSLELILGVLRDKEANIRLAATTALGNFSDTRADEALFRILGEGGPKDSNGDVRKAALESLGKKHDAQGTAILIRTLTADEDGGVRLLAAEILAKMGWVPKTTAEQFAYDIARRDWEALVPFGAPVMPFLLNIANDPDREIRQQVAETLKTTLASVKVVMFGNLRINESRKQITVANPEVDRLTIPMEALDHLVVHTPTYDFHQLERFLTYAINYIGQTHLKTYVTAHIYGDPDKLHPNLRNTLTNLCAGIEFHEST